MGAIYSRSQRTIDNQPKKDDKPISKPTPPPVSSISSRTSTDPDRDDIKASNFISKAQLKHVPHIKNSTSIRRADLPHYLDEILKEYEGKEIDRSSTDKLYQQLYDGIYLKGNKKKYWVDKNKANCFMLYAKDLSITWGEDKRYWKWFDIEETPGVTISVAQLESVCWLEVCGRFDSAALSPETLYEVLFEVKIMEESSGLNSPITLRFVLPNKYRKDVIVHLNEKEKEKWLQLKIGEFTSGEWAKKNEEIEIFMYEIKQLNWKRGLVVKGIIIRPKD